MQQLNLYKMILDNWYWNRFNSIKDYQKSIIHLNNSSFEKFTKEFRTIEMNLGRCQGATTAIINFIKEHSDLKINIITPNTNCMKDIKHKLIELDVDIKSDNIQIYSYTDIRERCIIFNTDIIFIDVASYIPQEYQKDLISFLSELNSGYNKNQWVIKFG